MAIRQGGQDRLVHPAALLLTDPQGRGDRGTDHRRIRDRDQVDEPRPVAEVTRGLRRDGQGQPGFPTPPGPTAVTWRCSLMASPSAADSRMRPMNGVNGEGSLATAAPDRSASASSAASWARPRRSGTPSLRSSEETCVSTVRTEMNSRAPISALLRCCATRVRTSASRAEIPAVADA
jgi:hypothetical protein